jgi:acetyl esterase/lipase
MRKLFSATLALSCSLAAQTTGGGWALNMSNDYQIVPNVTYLTAGGQELKLDVYRNRDIASPKPTLVYIHGGFWAAGTKEGSLGSILPWMEMGWNVVNVEYRLARVALAPAAVEDCLCALKFLNAQAKTHNIDPARIVVMGESAGGHLALMLGMTPEPEGLDRECAGGSMPRPAAIINWYGITDVNDVIDGPHRANAAMQWFGSMPNRTEVARRVSPLTYVRAGLPPILTIHGDADPTVPYEHAVRLHLALNKVGTPNQFHTVPGGKHGGFTREQRVEIYKVIGDFLAQNGIKAK